MKIVLTWCWDLPGVSASFAEWSGVQGCTDRSEFSPSPTEASWVSCFLLELGWFWSLLSTFNFEKTRLMNKCSWEDGWLFSLCGKFLREMYWYCWFNSHAMMMMGNSTAAQQIHTNESRRYIFRKLDPRPLRRSLPEPFVQNGTKQSLIMMTDIWL